GSDNSKLRGSPIGRRGASMRRILFLRSRWIRRIGHINVQEPFVRRVPGRITVSVLRIACRAVRGELLAAWRLRKLPDRSARQSPVTRSRRQLTKSAARSWRASIIEDPKDQRAPAKLVLQILGSRDARASAFIYRHRGTIHAGTEFLPRECVDPLVHVG